MAMQLQPVARPSAHGCWPTGTPSYGTPLTTLFAPSPRLAAFGLPAASVFISTPTRGGEPTFGVALTGLAILGLVVGWRRRSARLLGLLGPSRRHSRSGPC